MDNNTQDPFIPIIFPPVRERKTLARNIPDDEYKIAVVLSMALKRLTNRFDKKVSAEESDGEHVITFGEELNAFQLKLQNPLQHFPDDTISNALLYTYKHSYNPYEPSFYVNLAYDIINDQIESGMDEPSPYAQLTPENISDFSQWLADSDSFWDSIWHSAMNELDYYIEVKEDEANG